MGGGEGGDAEINGLGGINVLSQKTINRVDRINKAGHNFYLK